MKNNVTISADVIFDTINYNHALDLLKEKKYFKCVQKCTLAIQNSPMAFFLAAHAVRGQANYHLKNFDFANQDFVKISTYDDADKSTLYWQALTCRQLKLYDQSVKNLKKLVELDSGITQNYLELFELGFLTGNIDLSERYYTQFLELGYKNLVQLFMRSEENLKNGKKNLAKAMADFFIKHTPEQVQPFITRAQAYTQLEKFQLAIEDYNHAALVLPNEKVIYFNRANILRHLGENEKAKADFKMAKLLGVSLDSEMLDYIGS